MTFTHPINMCKIDQIEAIKTILHLSLSGSEYSTEFDKEAELV